MNLKLLSLQPFSSSAYAVVGSKSRARESHVCERRERAAEEVLQDSEDSGGSLYDDDANDDLLADGVTTPWNHVECQR